ncbi:MAG TPA: ATP-binding protein [Pseudobacteroides sp.]|nr:ATP-binding protein [Pseudobacteroides sp.]
MRKNLYNVLKNEYDKKQRLAYDNLVERRNKLYEKAPRLMEIEDEINKLGIKYNKMILLSENLYNQAVDELSRNIDSLKKEREDILVSMGYPVHYLEAVYECSLCKDKGYIEGAHGFESCTCFKQRFIALSFEKSNLKLTENENFDNFDETLFPDDVNEEKYGIKKSPRDHILGIKEKCLNFIENFSDPNEKNLYFCGPTGTGKTFMASCIASEILKRGGTVLYQTAPILFDTISSSRLKSFKDEIDEDSKYNSIFDTDLLIIDDLGTESQTTSRFAEFLNILNIRHLNNLSRPCKIIISTNIEANKLYDYYKERVASRIIGGFSFIKFAGEDIRSKTKFKKSI